MEEIVIWRAVQKMIDLYELDAGWQAALRADHLYNEGDIDGFNVWVKITKAIKEIQGIGSNSNDMRN